MELPLDSEDPLALKQNQEATKQADCNNGLSSPLSPPSTASGTIEREDGAGLGGAAAGSVEVEMLDQDHFEFLDRATELGSLRSEFNDVRNSLARRKTNGRYLPLKLYRSSRNNSISVTDVQSGLWCEVQVEYRYLHPYMKKTPQWSRMEEKGRPVQLKTQEMKQGTTIHLAKELEVHEVVKVETKTTEDRWAVNLIDTYSQLATVAVGGLEREIRVFGDLFGQGILVNGIIDQIQFCKDTGELTILDYKTRKTNTLPSSAQKQGHALQLMLYKCMLDSLTCGMTKMQILANHLNLNFSRELTEGVLSHIDHHGLLGLFTESGVAMETGDPGAVSESTVVSGVKLTFGEVACKMSSLIVGLGLPLVSSMMVQYVYQGTRQEIGMEVVDYDEAWMQKKFKESLEFWLGKREAKGVDLEEIWKCDSCQFKDICVWKKQKELEQSPAAFKPHHIF